MSMTAERSLSVDRSVTVSVVILNYNYANYVPAAIDSALNQTHQLVEVIVVDDASTDNSLDILTEYGTAITVITHTHNRGQGAAINSGWAAASGSIVWFVDADDALLPEACAEAARALRSDPSMGKFHAPLTYIDADGNESGGQLPADPRALAEGDIISHVFRYRNHGWPPMTGNAFPAATLKWVLPVPEQAYRQAADSFLCEQAAICGPVVRVSRPLATYRLHGANQFARRPLELSWLRTKLKREQHSHRRLVFMADRLGLPGCSPDPTAPLDVALAGYRLASLRLDPVGHPVLGSIPDSRPRLLVEGIRAVCLSPHLASTERIKRAVWFLAVATTPVAVESLLGWYMPDGPQPPVWVRWRSRLQSRSRPFTRRLPRRAKDVRLGPVRATKGES